MAPSAVSSSPSQFLELPTDIRHRIYAFAGLPTRGLIRLDPPGPGVDLVPGAPKLRVMGWATKSFTPGIQPPSRSDLFREEMKSTALEDFGSLHALLLTCRHVYSEISAPLYSKNTFLVQDSARLRALRPHSLARISRLRIFLHYRRESGRAHYCIHRYSPSERTFDLSDPTDQAKLADWDHTVSMISPHIRPGFLHLYFVCDLANDPDNVDEDPPPESVERVADTLRRLPRLASCHLRLGVRFSENLSLKTQQLVDELVPAQEIKPFQFTSLPVELQTRVIEFTELAPAGGSVLWEPCKGYSARSPVEYFYPESWRPPCRPKMGVGCFCRRKHAAASVDCLCGTSPGALFLVSKAMYTLARDVLFRKNRITIYKNFYSRWRQEEIEDTSAEPSRYPLTEYFTNWILPSSVPLLRSMTAFNCHGLHHGRRGKDQSAAALKWAQTLQSLKETSTLALRDLKFDDFWDQLYPYDGMFDQKPEVVLDHIRDVIHEHIWPLDDGPCAKLPFGTQKLSINSHHDETYVRYRCRIQTGADCLPIRPTKVSRLRQEMTMSRSFIVDNGKEMQTWIEEFWVRHHDRRSESDEESDEEDEEDITAPDTE